LVSVIGFGPLYVRSQQDWRCVRLDVESKDIATAEVIDGLALRGKDASACCPATQPVAGS